MPSTSSTPHQRTCTSLGSKSMQTQGTRCAHSPIWHIRSSLKMVRLLPASKSSRRWKRIQRASRSCMLALQTSMSSYSASTVCLSRLSLRQLFQQGGWNWLRRKLLIPSGQLALSAPNAVTLTSSSTAARSCPSSLASTASASYSATTTTISCSHTRKSRTIMRIIYARLSKISRERGSNWQTKRNSKTFRGSTSGALGTNSPMLWASQVKFTTVVRSSERISSLAYPTTNLRLIIGQTRKTFAISWLCLYTDTEPEWSPMAKECKNLNFVRT